LKVTDFSIDAESALPVYAQLRDQIVQAIGRGALRPNDQLPTVREIAVHLQINPNTVNRAYIELEREGALVTARGRGTFVATGTRRVNPEIRRARLREAARRALGEARAAGFDAGELVKAIVSIGRKET
jgi:GntR family transcriptional regulator